MFVCVYIHVPIHMGKSQRKPMWSWFFSATFLWILGLNLGYQASTTNVSTH